MFGKQSGWLAAMVLAVALMKPATSPAGSPLSCGLCKDPACPTSSYSPLHYWAPTLYRLHAWLHGPALNAYPPDRYPEIPPRYRIISYPCPSADPVSIYVNRSR